MCLKKRQIEFKLTVSILLTPGNTTFPHGYPQRLGVIRGPLTASIRALPDRASFVAQFCHNCRIIRLPIVTLPSTLGETFRMQHRSRPPLDHWEAAARFRLLAEIEPYPTFRQRF